MLMVSELYPAFREVKVSSVLKIDGEWMTTQSQTCRGEHADLRRGVRAEDAWRTPSERPSAPPHAGARPTVTQIPLSYQNSSTNFAKIVGMCNIFNARNLITFPTWG